AGVAHRADLTAEAFTYAATVTLGLPRDWEEAYRGRPPWDIGRPQPAFVDLAEKGLMRGRLLDAGCGTGEHTLLAVAAGAQALGVDRSVRAIESARAKAAERGVDARFVVADARRLEEL